MVFQSLKKRLSRRKSQKDEKAILAGEATPEPQEVAEEKAPEVPVEEPKHEPVEHKEEQAHEPVEKDEEDDRERIEATETVDDEEHREIDEETTAQHVGYNCCGITI